MQVDIDSSEEADLCLLVCGQLKADDGLLTSTSDTQHRAATVSAHPECVESRFPWLNEEGRGRKGYRLPGGMRRGRYQRTYL